MLLRKVRNRRNKVKAGGKLIGSVSAASGAGGIISAHNICHAACLGVVAALSVFGIAVSSTALMFLQDYNLLFWAMGIFFLLIGIAMYAKFGKCISRRLIAFNAGLVAAGTPFFPALQPVFWVTGFSISILVSGIYLSERAGVRI